MTDSAVSVAPQLPMKTPPRRIMRLQDLMAEPSLSRSTFHRIVDKGEFLRPVRIRPSAVGWRVDEIEAWLTHRDVAVCGRSCSADASDHGRAAGFGEHLRDLLHHKAAAADGYRANLRAPGAALETRTLLEK